jgi:hypothetical protein
MVFQWWLFLFLFLLAFHSFPAKPHTPIFFFVSFLNLVLRFFIVYFSPWPFGKVFDVINFIIESKFVIGYCFRFGPSSFEF